MITCYCVLEERCNDVNLSVTWDLFCTATSVNDWTHCTNIFNAFPASVHWEHVVQWLHILCVVRLFKRAGQDDTQEDYCIITAIYVLTSAGVW